MKVELSYADRSAIANLCRRRAMESQHNAEQTIDDRQKQEFGDEAQYFETLAIRLDDAEPLTQERRSEPIRADARRDLDYVDAPT